MTQRNAPPRNTEQLREKNDRGATGGKGMTLVLTVAAVADVAMIADVPV
jgi:hypothetical protein